MRIRTNLLLEGTELSFQLKQEYKWHSKLDKVVLSFLYSY